MKIALSNLAVPAQGFEEALHKFAAEGLSGVEIAPTRFADWDELDSKKLRNLRAIVEGAGLTVPSLQAILFGARDVALLADVSAFDRLLLHLKRVAEVGLALGASVAVFGAPRQRARGLLAPDAAFALGVGRLRRAAGLVQSVAGVTLVLEPVPEAYGSDFLTSWQDTLEMVRAVAHPGLRLHLDTGCVLLGGGDIAEAIQVGAAELAHFHIAEPKLGGFTQPVAHHVDAAAALCAIGYERWLSIEMLEQGGSDAEEQALQALKFARSVYANI